MRKIGCAVTRNWNDKADKLDNFCSVVVQLLAADLLSLFVIRVLPAG
jgi:hypothetical protein